MCPYGFDRDPTTPAEALQGEGTYTYSCHHPDCYYCELMRGEKHREFQMPVQLRKHTYTTRWSRVEIEMVIRDYPLSARELSEIIPGRSPESCQRQKIRLAKRHLI